MRLAGGTSVVLHPMDLPIAFELLLSQWRRAGFEPGPCRRSLEELVEQRSILAESFRPEEIERGGRAATDTLLFDSFSPDREWICAVYTGGPSPQRAGVRMPPSAVGSFARLLRVLGSSHDADELRVAAEPVVPPRITSLLCDSAAASTALVGAWPRVDAPGIYRREHASIVVRSRTTTILVDPQGLHCAESSNFGLYPAESSPLELDAIVITHQHNDHWHLPTLLYLAGTHDVPIIVPIAPRPNLLTREDFATSIQQIGLSPLAMAWHTTTRVGDIEITALPFFGEQPTRDAPGPADGLRSWGNCYRFTTPEFDALILVDSGIDPMGNMVDVVRRSVAERGPVDVVLSNCRAFPDVINEGLAHYSFALPFDRVRSTFLEHEQGRVALMTLGEDGVAEVCAAARARYFLPYAHMFPGLGANADGGTVAGVRGALERRGVRTEVCPWSPGDTARFEGGYLWIERAPTGTEVRTRPEEGR